MENRDPEDHPQGIPYEIVGESCVPGERPNLNSNPNPKKSCVADERPIPYLNPHP